MILTITLNPSIDIRYNLPTFTLGKVQRATSCEKTAGGKGLNVTRIIKKLSLPVLATGFIGGKLGEDLINKLNFQKIDNDFVKIQCETRNCINIIHDNMSTELLENGPTISKQEWESFKVKFQELSKIYKFICASGSLPAGLSTNSYSELIEIANNSNCKFFLDTSGKALEESLNTSPYFIKPNLEELQKLVNKNLETLEEIISEAKILNKKGIELVAVTLGEKGSILVTKNKTYIATIPKFEVLNTVGCGDSFVGGFIAGIEKNLSLEECFKLAIACSISNALLEETGNIIPEIVENLKKQITISIK